MHAGIVKALLVTIVAVQLVACGGGGGGSTASGASTDSVSPSAITPAGNTGTGTSTNRSTTSNTGSGTNTTSSTTNNTGTATSTSTTSTLTLSWVAPVIRSDGTPLSLADIDGFNLYYGKTPGNYPNHVNVTDGTAQEATLNNLAVGTYYIVMTTYDVEGRESSYSVMVKKTTS